jgi:hypothetical protein
MKFHKSEETLEKIKNIITSKKRGGYFRFGDGDINLANNMSELLQSSNSHLQKEMSEALSIKDENVLKTLPLYCKEYDGWEEGMFPGNHECNKDWADEIILKAKPYWGSELGDVYSHVALHFLATEKPGLALEFLKFIKNKKPIAIIGNENIPEEIISNLFGSQCNHIKTLPEGSYSSLDSVENQLDDIMNQKNQDYSIIITSLGCSGRALQNRLYKKYNNVFLFDFGSMMDGLCGWNTRAWIELTNFDKNFFLNNI